MFKISIIVPLYNSEDTILSCLTSIVDQDWPRKEVIVVDDGSTDSSLSKCNEFAKFHQDIVVISKIHSGPSSCRNLGLRVSTGSYILFCDADDELMPSALSAMIHLFDSSIDLVVGNVHKNNAPALASSARISKNDALRRFFRHDNERILGTVYGKMFRRSLISPPYDSCLSFDESISIGEDALFLLKYLIRCRTIQLSANYIYYHKQNPNGIISSSQLNEYLTALDASKKMIEVVFDDKDLINLAIADLFWVFVLVLKRFSSIPIAEIVKDRLKAIIESLHINLKLINLPVIFIESNDVCVNYVSYYFKLGDGDELISVDMSNLGIMIMPSFVNMHIHLEDYCDKPMDAFNSTEDFLSRKVFNSDVQDNISKNLSVCEREGCLAAAYTHHSSIQHNTVSILHLSKTPYLLNENGWMLNSILSYEHDKILSIFSQGRNKRKPIFFHLSSSIVSDQKERLQYNGSFISFLAKKNLLSEFCYIIHGSYLNTQELDLISKNRANIIICPLAEDKLNEHYLSIDDLSKRGIPWMLGTDSQAAAGTSSILDNAIFLHKRQVGIEHNLLLYSISMRPIESSLKWALPLIQRWIVIDIGQIPATQVQAIDILHNVYKPICSLSIIIHKDS